MTCKLCGCAGFHACPGQPVGKWTQAEKDKLREALRKVAEREAMQRPSAPVGSQRKTFVCVMLAIYIAGSAILSVGMLIGYCDIQQQLGGMPWPC